MGINIGRYNFSGPFGSTDVLEDRSGIYAILTGGNPQYHVIDIGESANVKSRIEGHDRKDCWRRNAAGTVKVAVLYTPNGQQSGRIAIEQELRSQFNPVCGLR
jgi:hypothetical protein